MGELKDMVKSSADSALQDAMYSLQATASFAERAARGEEGELADDQEQADLQAIAGVCRGAADALTATLHNELRPI
jgi:hypothetical protein